RHHADRVGAADLAERALHRVVEAPRDLQVVLDQVGQNLGVGLRPEGVSLDGQPLLDLEVVFEDPVVDDDQAARAVGVRMRVLLRGPPVGRPARVADADGAAERAVAERRLQHLQAAGRPPDLEGAVVSQGGHARGIVAAVLEALEALDDDADRALVTDVSDDPTHRAQSFRAVFAFAARSRALRSVQPGLSTCWARPRASAPAGTSRVTVEPAAT